MNNIILEAVIKTLDTIPIQGRDNMQKIMACITVLEKIINDDVSDIHISGCAERKDADRGEPKNEGQE